MGNKPAAGAAGMRVPANWNFNVSHEGRYVALAAEPMVVVGIDIAAPEEARARKAVAGLPPKKGGMDEQLRIMRDQLTDAEKAEINSHRPDERKMEHAFRKFWSLKGARSARMIAPFSLCGCWPHPRTAMLSQAVWPRCPCPLPQTS